MTELLLILIATVTLAAATEAAPAQTRHVPRTTFYVATNGSDGWSGRLPRPNPAKTDGPFATVGRARDAVRALKARGELTAPVTVTIGGGLYSLPETLEFGPEDSGTEACPVTYAANPGEKPVLSGGRRISEWRKGEGPLWTAQIPEVAEGRWYFHQLFVNSERRTRARTPNEGYLRTAGPLAPLGDRSKARGDAATKRGFRYKEGDLQRYANLEDVNLIVYHAWTASWHHIAELDTEARTVKFTAPSGWPIGWWENEQRYVVENCREALDSPGEWYLDRKSGVLTYWPIEGEDPTKAEIVAPALEQVLRLTGEPETGIWVEHLRFEGLSFQHADWSIARDKSADGQAATFAGAAVMASGARECAFERCEIAHVGQHALWLGRGCQENRVEQCHIHDLGAGGVYVGEPARQTVPAAACGRNRVYNCFIHDGGHVFAAGIGVWVGQSSHNIVSHNEICDFYYSGMSLGWTWGYGPSDAHHNLVEYNHIHHIGQGVLSDMGAVYTLGISPGTVIRNNLIHDILSYSYGGWGLYTDEGSSGILMENNVVYLTKSGGFHQHYGKENTLGNNIFADASEGEVIRSRQEEHLSFFFEGNIVYQSQGPLLGGNWGNHNYRMDRNVYWHTSGGCDLAGLPPEEWQEETGQDKQSLFTDPGFVDAAGRNYALKPDSPARKLGFKPIDLSRVGLEGPKEWVDAPRKIRRTATQFPAPTPVGRQPVEDGFDATPVGEPPANATVSGEENGASVRVTDETAATGKRCLKFTDAPGLSHNWQPHLVYGPRFYRGTVRISYDLRVEPGAIAWVEGRDNASPYNAGPSLRIEGGQLLAGTRALLPIPASQWVRFEITCALGKQTTGAYDLTVTLPGGEVKRFAGLPLVKKEFRQLLWLGFISEATEKTVFYLDNVKVAPLP